jgi:hypothetical protein
MSGSESEQPADGRFVEWNNGVPLVRLGDLLTFVFGGVGAAVAFDISAVIRSFSQGIAALVSGLAADLAALLRATTGTERALTRSTFDQSAAAIGQLGVPGFVVAVIVVLVTGWLFVQFIERLVGVVR